MSKMRTITIDDTNFTVEVPSTIELLIHFRQLGLYLADDDFYERLVSPFIVLNTLAKYMIEPKFSKYYKLPFLIKITLYAVIIHNILYKDELKEAERELVEKAVTKAKAIDKK
jgi:hypothetical protein